jgi:2-phospho-L-lactate guanylyltransferase (CobY/MobA/RfbA family)
MDAVILAGALNTGTLQQLSAAQYEAEIEIDGRPMLDYIILALKSVTAIERIVVAGPERVLSDQSRALIYQRVESGESMIDSLINGLNILRGNSAVLVVTSDIPLLSKEAVEDFLTNCKQRNGDVYYSFIAKENCEIKYPGVSRTYVKLREGTFTGGNIALISQKVIRDHIDMLKKAVTMRKKPLQLGSLLGWKCLFHLVLGKITIAEIENRIDKTFQFKAVGVISQYPEIGIDVDKPSDLILARKILTKPLN